jgi:hypothetical protein
MCMCPRCGYDLSGIVATWADACPLEGRCSECGLTFAWAELMVPARRQVKWFVEHERGLVRVVWAGLVTWAWMVWPPVFWRRARLEGELRVWRAVAWLVVVIAVGRVFAAVFAGAAMWWLVGPGAKPWPGSPGWPNANPVRATWQAAMSAAATPWVSISQGLPGWPPGKVVIAWAPYGVPGYVPGFVLLQAVFVVALLGLPDTRKRAKVRARHVLRAAVYGMAPVALLAWLAPWAALASLISIIGNGNFDFPGLQIVQELSRSLSEAWPLTFFLLGAWTVMWWRGAVRSYRMDQQREVWRVLMVMAGLVGAIVYGPALIGYLDSGVY